MSPARPHEVRPPWILGFDIGGTKTAVIAGTTDGEILERSIAALGSGAFQDVWAGMTEVGDRLVLERGRPQAIGVSIGGPVDTQRGVVHSPPNLSGWDALPLKDLLVGRFGVPTFVEHDARAGVLAEWLHGAARGFQHVIFLTFGTGLGAGLIVNGRLVRGSSDLAGEVGHWRMIRRGPAAYRKVGSWEALSSGAGIPRLARHLFADRLWAPELTAEDIVGLARAGDPQAVKVVATSATWLGRGIAQLVDLLDPDIVVLGSLAVRAGDLFLPIARRVVDREALPRGREHLIVSSELGEGIGDVASICAATYRLHQVDEAQP